MILLEKYFDDVDMFNYFELKQRHQLRLCASLLC